MCPDCHTAFLDVLRPRAALAGAARATTLAALLLTASGTAFAQTTGNPDTFGPPTLLKVVPAGEIGPGSQFTSSAHGLLSSDGVRDVALLVGARVHVLVNPGRWQLSIELTGGTPDGFKDLDVVPYASTPADGLVTVDANGLLLWRWRDDLLGFESHPIGGPFTNPLLVRAASPTSGISVVSVLDRVDVQSYQITSLTLMQGGTPGTPPVVGSISPPILLGGPALDFALFDYQADANHEPELAVALESGLTVHSLQGILLGQWASSVSSSLLVPMQQDAISGLPVRLAWVRKPLGAGSQKVTVLDAAGLEDVKSLGISDASAASAGDLGPDTAQELVLGRLGGQSRIHLNGCGLSGTSFNASTHCSEGLPAPATAGFDAFARPLLADLDVDGLDDLLMGNDGTGAAALWRRLPPAPTSQPILPFDVDLLGWDPSDPTLTGDPLLRLVLAAGPLIVAGTTHIEVIVWPMHDYAEYELDPGGVGYYYGAFSSSDGIWTEDIQLSLGTYRPPVLGIEVRALVNRQAVDVNTYLITRVCSVYDDLVCAQGLPGKGPPEDGCEDFVWSCQEASQGPPLGDYIGGLVPVPRMPPFTGNQVPTFPGQ